MSTQVKTKRKAASSRVAQVDRYVGQQLKQTIRQVRVSDTIAAFIAMLVFLIAYFIVVAFIDAWVWPLSTTGRIIGLAILAAGICFIAWKMFFPLVMRKINPQYAAKMIEEAKPTFKNSLLNYLSLRKKESKTRRAVLQEVTRKAATDLKSVSVDSMVDRSNIIRMGFTLVAIFSLAIVYSVLSPKNPLQTVARILAPTAKISKPAVVRINNVTPGDTDVFFGDQLEVTAEILGRHEPEDVRMFFSTVDGQMRDVAVAMQPGTKKTEYVGKLTTGPAGIQSPLIYWIEARDGRTPDFEVNVRTNPAISINQITITPPEYTRLPERIIEGQGEVQCPEGSNVSVRATANLPIELAYLELLQAKSDDPNEEDFTSEDIEMKFEGNEAQGRFVATLNSKRTKQRYTHYRVRFVSKNGFRNENPNTYPIRVIADLGPQVEIIRPTEKEVMLPVNQPLLVEVRAEDLDFEIKSVDLQFDHQGTELHDRNLHMNLQKEQPTGREGGAGLATSGRVTAQSIFTPEDFNLNPGDKVIVHAAAADNRMSINGQPAPNISYTDNYLLVITEPVANPRQPKTNDEKKEEQERQNQQDNQQQDSSDQGSSKDNKQGDSDSEQEGGNKGEGQSSENEAQEQQGDSSEGENGNSEQSESGDDGSRSQDSGNSESQQGNDSGESGDQSADGKSGSESQNSDGGSDSENSNEQKSDGSSDDNGSSQATGNSKSDANDASETGGGADSNSAQTDNDPNGNSRGDSQTDGGKNTEGSSSNRQQGDGGSNDDSQASGEGARDNSLNDGQQEPLADDATDREKFERLKEWADQQGESSDQDSQEQDGGPSESGDPNDGDGGEQSSQGNDSDQTDPGQKQNSQKRDDQRGDGQSSEEPASDGNPNNGAKDGAQSQDGSPDGKPGDQSDSKTGQGDPSDSKGGDADPAGSQDSQPQDSQQPGDGGSQKGGDQNKPGNSDDQNPSGEDGNQPGSKSGDNNQPGQEQPGDNPNDGQSGGGGEGEQQPGGGAEGGAQESGEGGAGSQGGKGGGQQSQGGQKSPDGQGGSASDGGGQGAGGGGSSSGGAPTDGAVPKGDDANLNYAKKATDMILNNLEDEKFDPSQELLDDMNMSADELREFVDRWQKMKQNARTNNTDRRKYENALRSLNLKPKTRGRTVRTKKDNLRGLSEDNALDQIPAGVDVNEFHEYLKSRNRDSRRPRK